jgi:transcriptional repressor NrdR
VDCLYCDEATRVVDSRDTSDGEVVRRRRECVDCGERFTTYERAELRHLEVEKRDGSVEPFDREKLAAGVRRACEKRPVPDRRIDEIITAVEEEIRSLREPVVESDVIGARVCERLKEEDEVAYLRFASVYKEFSDGSQFVRELADLSTS